MPPISILIPLFNKAPYIAKALDSVYAQTFSDYDCIIIDDGSTDGSFARAEEWIGQHQDSRFRLISHTNAGVAAARNHAASLTQADYLAFLDADDWWEPTFLQELYTFALQHPEAALWATNYIYFKPGKTRIGATDIAYLAPDSVFINYPLSYYQGTGMPIWTGATLVSHTAFSALGGFPPHIHMGEDFLLWSQFALHYPIAFLDRPLAYYNNSLPTTSSALRATTLLHHPDHHMLFHLQSIESLLSQSTDSQHLPYLDDNNLSVSSSNHLPFPSPYDWHLLLDKLRIHGLMTYWLDSRYHQRAAAELAKVNIPAQSSATRSFYCLYSLPLWLLRFRQSLLVLGSRLKTCFRH